ncbi:5\'-methylthioadenosine/S-adenosylhomocysteine nucleosidase [Alteracholeplasma palmae J233]|uniref:adenosylhomocysteine nucleosidase n=1 Tax=Alteracholeplasma palmae (strain ATCC 49389 / J233) TaxID=1318466 RepID=U4KJV9_ALTPJ|nr:5'-methylthioadenosine/S-adenosylhomocysteine nucleosidase [Alteracholeplasma palmae]CCV63859.1 5\'-methylthioadenosine/S-adenosylhomocysteine nucleosidase [Alteracholeplasma palmae J233]
MKLIIAAMQEEIKGYINGAKLVSEKPFLVYEKKDTIAIISGIGKVNAAASLTYALTKYKNIDLIINIGFVGGYEPLEQKDIVIVKNSTYHDFDLSFFGYKKGQVPKMPELFETDTKFLDKFKNYKKVSLYTGDTFMTEKLITEDVIIADMEGTAYYHVAHLFNTPILAIKVISDVIGKNNQLDDYKAFESTKQDYIDDVLKTILKEV